MPSHFDHELVSTRSQPSSEPAVHPATAVCVKVCQARYDATPNASHASTRSVQRTGALNAGAVAELSEFQLALLCLPDGTRGTNEDIISIYVVARLAASGWFPSLARLRKSHPTTGKVRLS